MFVMEAMWTRFLPTIQEVVKTVEKGEIGEVIQVDATFCFRGNADPENRRQTRTRLAARCSTSASIRSRSPNLIPRHVRPPIETQVRLHA
ncbi:MAG: hypothetical protein MZU97_03390 [Bacillus subtilis]|nr:hypothetical protein [Bacillus subtilis]